MAIHSSILAWRIYGQRSLVGYGPQCHKKLNTTEVTAHTHTHTHTQCTHTHSVHTRTVYVCQSQSLNSSHLPLPCKPPPTLVHTSVLYISVYIPAL